MSATAKLFMHGRSQAVRLPKEFRFEGSEVRVSKVGDKVILEPLMKQAVRCRGLARETRRVRGYSFHGGRSRSRHHPRRR